MAAEEAPPPHVVYRLGRGPPPEPDALPGFGVNSLGAFESWSRATTASWQMRGAGWLTESLDWLVETRLAFLFLLPAVLRAAR